MKKTISIFLILVVLLTALAGTALAVPTQESRFVPTVTQRLPYTADFSRAETINDFVFLPEGHAVQSGRVEIVNGMAVITRTEAEAQVWNLADPETRPPHGVILGVFFERPVDKGTVIFEAEFQNPDAGAGGGRIKHMSLNGLRPSATNPFAEQSIMQTNFNDRLIPIQGAMNSIGSNIQLGNENAQPDAWYTLRYELNMSTRIGKYYFNGELKDTFTIHADVVDVNSARFQMAAGFFGTMHVRSFKVDFIPDPAFPDVSPNLTAAAPTPPPAPAPAAPTPAPAPAQTAPTAPQTSDAAIIFLFILALTAVCTGVKVVKTRR